MTDNWQKRARMQNDVLLSLFADALEVTLPRHAVPKHLPKPPKGRTIVIGAGKASAAMAQALEAHWQGPIEGLVVTRYGHATPCKQIEIVEAAHPVPDEAGRKAASRIFIMVQGFTEDDLVIALISGGGSALLALPAEGLTLEDKQEINSALLKSGATITEMNCLRKHLSKIKGGRLAKAAYPAPIHALMISDIPGDDLSMIASGPTVPDPTTLGDSRLIVSKYQIELPEAADILLQDLENETPKPGDPIFERVENILIATPQMALEAAAKTARSHGMEAQILSDKIEGEARDVGVEHAILALEHAADDKPCVILSGGETTVTVKGKGRGGRNVEFLLSLAIALNGAQGISALACDTDGIDGSEDNAGARITPDTLARAAALDLNPAEFLENNDAYSFFEALGDLIITGPTLTNVNDFRAILIE